MKTKGLIIGEIEGRISKLDGIMALLDSGLSSKQAVRKCLRSFQRRQPTQLVTLSNAVHTMVVAPTGVGKGVSCIIPFLLTCPESCVVYDPKGENAAITAAARRKMGHQVIIIDPFCVVGGTETYNVLDSIDPESPTALDEIRDLAEALVVRTGQEKDPHWSDSAQLWITGMIAAVVAFAEPDDRNMQSVRALLTSTPRMDAAIGLMVGSPLWAGMLARNAEQLRQFEGKERASVLTTTNRNMNFLDTLAIAESTQASNFDVKALLKGKMTVYLVLPPEHQRSQSALLRLWISSLLRTVVKGGLSNRKVHFVLDESASLGQMASLEDALDKYRSYGVRLQLFYQSMGQLKTCWPDGKDVTLLSNVTQVFFGVNDQQTAEYVSNRLGEETICVSSGGYSSGSSQQHNKGETSHSTSTNSNSNWNQIARRLLKPEEVANLDPRIAITLAPGCRPIATILCRFYEKTFQQRRGMSLFRILLDTFSLAATVALVAVLTTAVLLQTVR